MQNLKKKFRKEKFPFSERLQEVSTLCGRDIKTTTFTRVRPCKEKHGPASGKFRTGDETICNVTETKVSSKVISGDKEQGEIVCFGFSLLRHNKSDFVTIKGFFFDVHQPSLHTFSNIYELGDQKYVIANQLNPSLYLLDKYYKIRSEQLVFGSDLFPSMCQIGSQQALVAFTKASAPDIINIAFIDIEDTINVKPLFKIESYCFSPEEDCFHGKGNCANSLQVAYMFDQKNDAQRICVYNGVDHEIHVYSEFGTRIRTLNPVKDSKTVQKYKLLMTGLRCRLFVYIGTETNGRGHLLRYDHLGYCMSITNLNRKVPPDAMCLFPDLTGNLYLGHRGYRSVIITKITDNGIVYKYKCPANCEDIVTRGYFACSDMFVCLKNGKVCLIDSCLKWK